MKNENIIKSIKKDILENYGECKYLLLESDNVVDAIICDVDKMFYIVRYFKAENNIQKMIDEAEELDFTIQDVRKIAIFLDNVLSEE